MEKRSYYLSSWFLSVLVIATMDGCVVGFIFLLRLILFVSFSFLVIYSLSDL